MKLLVLLLPLMLASSIGAMDHLLSPDATPKKTERQRPALTGWPLTFYDNVYPGASYNFRRNADLYLSLCTRAFTATREEADERHWPAERGKRLLFDWYNAVYHAEKDLMAKPFEKWTIADIVSMARCLERLSTIQEAGAFRSKHALTERQHLSHDEKRLMRELLQREAQNDEERAFLEEKIYFFVDPLLIVEELNNALLQAQRTLAEVLPSKSARKRALAITQIAAHMFYEIYRIHPFETSSESLCRLVSALMMARYGVKPLIFPSQSSLTKVLQKCLCAENSHALEHYMLHLLKNRKPFHQFSQEETSLDANESAGANAGKNSESDLESAQDEKPLLKAADAANVPTHTPDLSGRRLTHAQLGLRKK